MARVRGATQPACPLAPADAAAHRRARRRAPRSARGPARARRPPRRARPAELGLGLARVADEELDLSWSVVLRVDAHQHTALVLRVVAAARGWRGGARVGQRGRGRVRAGAEARATRAGSATLRVGGRRDASGGGASRAAAAGAHPISSSALPSHFTSMPTTLKASSMNSRTCAAATNREEKRGREKGRSAAGRAPQAAKPGASCCAADSNAAIHARRRALRRTARAHGVHLAGGDHVVVRLLLLQHHPHHLHVVARVAPVALRVCGAVAGAAGGGWRWRRGRTGRAVSASGARSEAAARSSPTASPMRAPCTQRRADTARARRTDVAHVKAGAVASDDGRNTTSHLARHKCRTAPRRLLHRGAREGVEQLGASQRRHPPAPERWHACRAQGKRVAETRAHMCTGGPTHSAHCCRGRRRGRGGGERRARARG